MHHLRHTASIVLAAAIHVNVDKQLWLCRYTGPVDYDNAFAAMKAALGEGFWGPADTGVYSPSVQYTLFQMAKRALERCAQALFMQRRMSPFPFSHS